VKIEPKPDEKPEDRAIRQKKAENLQLRKARAASWALVYFLAKNNSMRPGLLRYLRELSQQPRDMELDARTLLGCFQRAFPGESMASLANRWINFINRENLEAEGIHKKIREIYDKMNKPPARGNNTPGPGVPGGGPALGRPRPGGG
jgi:hypothetical protein